MREAPNKPRGQSIRVGVGGGVGVLVDVGPGFVGDGVNVKVTGGGTVGGRGVGVFVGGLGVRVFVGVYVGMRVSHVGVRVGV